MTELGCLLSVGWCQKNHAT